MTRELRIYATSTALPRQHENGIVLLVRRGNSYIKRELITLS